MNGIKFSLLTILSSEDNLEVRQQIKDSVPENYFATLELAGKKCTYDGLSFMELVEFKAPINSIEPPQIIEATPELLEQATVVDNSLEACLANLSICVAATGQTIDTASALMRIIGAAHGQSLIDSSESMKAISDAVMVPIQQHDTNHAWLINSCINLTAEKTGLSADLVAQAVHEMNDEERLQFVAEFMTDRNQNKENHDA